MNESNGEDVVDNESEGNDVVVANEEEMIDDDDVVEENKENVPDIVNSNPMINNYLNNEQHVDSNNNNLNRKQSQQSFQKGFHKGTTNDEIMSMNIELNNKNEFVGMEHFDEASKIGFGIAEDDNISMLRPVHNKTQRDNMNDNVTSSNNNNQINTIEEKEMICENGDDDVIKQKLETKLHLDDHNVLYYEIQNFKTWKKFINGKIRFFLPGENNKNKLYSKKIVTKREVSGFKKLAQKKKGKQLHNNKNNILANSVSIVSTSNNNNNTHKPRQISEVNLNEDVMRCSVGNNNDNHSNHVNCLSTNNINPIDYSQILKENEELRQRNIDLIKTIEHLEKELNIIKQSIIISSSSSSLQPLQSSPNVILTNTTNNKHYIENERYNK